MATILDACGCPMIEGLPGDWRTMHIVGKCRALFVSSATMPDRSRDAAEFPADIFDIPCECGLIISTAGHNYALKSQEGDVMRWQGVACACGKSYTVEAVANEDPV